MINRSIASIIPHMPKKLVWQISRKYIAGDNLESAINKARILQQKGIKFTFDILGEEFSGEEDAINRCREYIQSVRYVHQHKIQTTFSLKPTMFGLKYDIDFCQDLIRQIVEEAKSHNYMVRLDMEDSTCTDAIIEMFRKLYVDYPEHVGLVLQAYLYRTNDDIMLLEDLNTEKNRVNIRLCKGIYIEPQSISIHDKQKLRDNFIKLLNYMFEKNFFAAIATHDKYLIDKSLDMIYEKGLNKDAYEFQMLYGVRFDLRNRLLKQNQPVRIYLPYGKEWFKYSTRRLRENPSIVSHIIKSLVMFR